MADKPREAADIRRDIAGEREALAGAVEELRESLDPRPKLPVLVAGAAGVGFVLGGGIGATARFFFRLRRERRPRARAGRYTAVG
jgi:hypothetical protein